MIELSRTQDEEVGDGTTSVIVVGMFYTDGFILSSKKSSIYQDIILLVYIIILCNFNKNLGR